MCLRWNNIHICANCLDVCYILSCVQPCWTNRHNRPYRAAGWRCLRSQTGFAKPSFAGIDPARCYACLANSIEWEHMSPEKVTENIVRARAVIKASCDGAVGEEKGADENKRKRIGSDGDDDARRQVTNKASKRRVAV